MDKIICSGALFYSLDTRRYLFLHRANGKQNNLWGLVGGKNEKEETPWIGLQREIKEEIGAVNIKKVIPLETFVSNDEQFLFHTYLCATEEEFIPDLNHEHDGYAWCRFTKWPKPLHTGLRNTLNNKINLVKLETVSKMINLMETNYE